MDDAAPASPATPTTAATAGTEGSPLKRRLSALLLSDGKGGKAAAAAAASPLYLEPGRMERLLSSEFGEDVVQLCEMIAATGARGAVYGGGNPPPLTPTPGSGSSPPPPRRRLLHGDDDEDGESEGPGAAGAGGRGLPPPSMSREGAGSCASEDGSDDDYDEEGGGQVSVGWMYICGRSTGRSIDGLTESIHVTRRRRAPGSWTPSAGGCCSCRHPRGSGTERARR